MVQRIEMELRLFAPGADDLVVLRGRAHRGVGMREIRDRQQGGVQLCVDFLDLLFRRAHLLAEPFSFRLQFLFLGIIPFPTDSLGQVVGTLLERLCLLDEAFSVVVEPHDEVRVRGRHVAVAAVRFDGVEVGADGLDVEHD